MTTFVELEKITNDLIDQATNIELVERLILSRAKIQTLEQEEKLLKESLMSRSDFTKMEYAWIKVDVRQTKHVSFIKWVDMKSLRKKYPNIVSKKDVLNPWGISEHVLEYIKQKNPDAFYEEFDWDAKLINQIEPWKWTEQKVSTAVYITGMPKVQ